MQVVNTPKTFVITKEKPDVKGTDIKPDLRAVPQGTHNIPEKGKSEVKNVDIKPDLRAVSQGTHDIPIKDNINIKETPKSSKEIKNIEMFDSKIEKNEFSFNKEKVESKLVFKANYKSNLKEMILTESTNDPKLYGKNKDFYYVNGIMTKASDAQNTANKLCEVTGQTFKPIHNPTKGVAKDVLETAAERFNDTKFDMVTVNTAAKFVETLSQGRELKIVCHSQGSAITSDALSLSRKMLCEKLGEKKASEMMSKVEVIAFGGAADKGKYPKDIKLVNVVNPADPVPKIVATSPMSNKMRQGVGAAMGSLAVTPFCADGIKFLINTPVAKNMERYSFGLAELSNSLSIKGYINPMSHLVDKPYIEDKAAVNLLRNFVREDLK